MPSSVAIRRGTRVFGMVKGAYGVRVLRSGRRLFPGSGERQVKRVKYEEQSLPHSTKKYQHKFKDAKLKRKASGSSETEEAPMSVKRARRAVKKVNELGASAATSVKRSGGSMDEVIDKMFGIVYRRKRKRASVDSHGYSANKMYGIPFSMRQARKNERDVVTCAFVIVVQSPATGAASLLTSILRHIKIVDVGLSELAGFMFSEPLSSAFASSGFRFLQDAPAARSGICKLYKSTSLVPLFDLDFSVIPSWFMSMHLNLVLGMSRFPASKSPEEYDEIMIEDEVDRLCESVKIPVPVRSSKFALKSNQSKNSHHNRSVQKRSARRRMARNPSMLEVRKANGLLLTNSVESRKDNLPLSSFVSKYNLQNISQASCVPARPKEAVSTDQPSCSADILVIESHRCYRLKGATILIQTLDSKESLLVLKKDWATRLSFLPENYMRPSYVNRVTRNVMWSRCLNWKLEFPSRQDWYIFRELYKECVKLNAPSTTSKAIPVPGVREVAEYENNCFGFFSRPDGYISVND
ncbi:hypothetical protein LINPERPRIM_LOCUS23607 [Linum perenne]